MALALSIGKCSILGNYRENNEDAIEAKQFPNMTVCIVADGMGGQAAGEIASNRTIEVLPRKLRRGLLQATNLEQSKAVIRKAVVQANEDGCGNKCPGSRPAQHGHHRGLGPVAQGPGNVHRQRRADSDAPIKSGRDRSSN